MSLNLRAGSGGAFELHPEGIFVAVCVGVMDQGFIEKEWQGVRRMTPSVKLYFETTHICADGKRGELGWGMTASLHPKSKLAQMIGKWRGRPLGETEDFDLTKLVGASCTLVVSHSPPNESGKIYANIDAISKPTAKLVASGQFDMSDREQKFQEWRRKQTWFAESERHAGAVAAPLAAAVPTPPPYRPLPAAVPAPAVPMPPTAASPASSAPVSPIDADDVPF